MKQGGTHKAEKNNGQMFLIALMSFVIIVSAGVFLFLHFYTSYIDVILYHERLKQMQEVTSQLFNGLEDVIQNQWEKTDTFCNYVELGKPETTDRLLTFMKKQASLNNLDEEDHTKLVAVDELGRYLTQDGWQGTLTDMGLLVDKPEKISFISQSMINGQTMMYFLNRLETPVTFQDGDRSVTLIYYGLVQNMNHLDHYFSCEAYGGNNNVYVLNKKGVRAFHSGTGKSPLRGYNAYSTLEKMEYLHGTSFEEARSDLEKNGISYSNAILDGEEYYYALYQMDKAEWVLLFLVPSSYVAQDTVTLIGTTERMILIFALILIAVLFVVIYRIMRTKQRLDIEAERRNSEFLTRINGELDRKNSELAVAVKTAELAEQKAKNASKAKSDFLSNMSHDIRTPMNAIVGITKLMEHDQDDPEKMKLYIHKVQSSSQHLLSLINDVLDMSKIESSEVSLSYEPVSLAEQIGQIDSIIRPQADERGQDFLIRVHEIVHEYLLGDAVRLRQIFINILSNAVKYTPNGGKITLDLTELPGQDENHAVIGITVTDTGRGMTKEFLEHIFEPFTRAEDSMTNKVQGTGLGMAITKSIVDLMGGKIEVTSEPGKGSCFYVELPFAINQEIRQEVHAKKVLLITEDEILLRNVSASFKRSGVEFYTAKTKEEVVASLREHKVDTILLSGHTEDPQLQEIVRLLRERAADAVLVFCVDYSQKDEVSELLKNSGVNGLIARPFFFSNFVSVVNEARGDGSKENTEEDFRLKGMRFLCAEDNALNAEILEALLEINGASCDIYPDGEKLQKAFEKVKPGDYSAILMDVQMPVMNGLDATKAIRNGENPLGKTIPIIAMTANAFSSDVQACLDAGMDAHVAKPLDLTVLERTLKRVINEKTSGLL